MFCKDTITDSNGISDLMVCQRSETIITLTKDLKQIRVWYYMIYHRQRAMPPMDELPVNYQHVDPNYHVFVVNKKNIHLLSPIVNLTVVSDFDLILG